MASAAGAQHWTLEWSDEFNGAAGAAPSPANWTYDTGDSGFGNPEIETYCAPRSAGAPCVADQSNAFQDGKGNLVIEARRDATGRWSSARLKTQGLRTFRYGRIEARMRLPVGNGLWPAFWMLGATVATEGWPRCGEQDVMEWVQRYGPGTTSSTTHGPGYSAGNGLGAEVALPNGGRVDDGFHVYGVIWKPDSLQYYRDSPSRVFQTVTRATIPKGTEWVFNAPFFLLLNLAVGKGGFPGATDGSTPATASMVVDYVRVYRSEPVAGGEQGTR